MNNKHLSINIKKQFKSIFLKNDDNEDNTRATQKWSLEILTTPYGGLQFRSQTHPPQLIQLGHGPNEKLQVQLTVFVFFKRGFLSFKRGGEIFKCAHYSFFQIDHVHRSNEQPNSFYKQ